VVRVGLGPLSNLGCIGFNHFVVGRLQVGPGIVERNRFGRDALLPVVSPLLLDPGPQGSDEWRHHVEQVLRAFEPMLCLPASRQVGNPVPLNFLQSQNGIEKDDMASLR